MFIRLLPNRLIIGLFVGIAMMGIQTAKASPHKYLGYKRCRGCHKKEYNSWKDSTMARVTFAALVPGQHVENKKEAGLDPLEDFTQNPKCLRCHATGYGKPGGFINFAKTPDLAGVTCEACHNPGERYSVVMGKTYRFADLLAAGYVRPDQSVCDKCHIPGCPTTDDDYSMDFDDTAGHDRFPLKYEH